MSSKSKSIYLTTLAALAVVFLFVFIFFGLKLSNNTKTNQNQPAQTPELNKSKTPKNTPTSSLTAPPDTAAPASLPPVSVRKQYKYEALLNPSGTLYNIQPFTNRISAPSSWSMFASSNPAPTVAVIDTGFALNHESLISRWITKPAESSTPLTDNDGNGYVGDWRGWDFVHNDNDPSAGTSYTGSSASHGTLTSSLAGFINPNAKIMPLQALDDTGVGYTDDVAAAVRYAADNGANIISLSLGSDGDDPYLREQINYATSRGVVIIAAAGNSGCDCLSYPAAYPEVVAVGASDQYDNRAYFSSYGANLDVLAPGTAGDVCSAYYSAANSTNAYTCGFSGTSLSTPIVSGLAALLWQQNPTSADNIIASITHRADKTSSMSGLFFTNQYGYGRINAASAITGVTISAPSGVLVNKTTISLSSADISKGPIMNSTCSGVPTALCSINLSGPEGQNVSLGNKSLNDFGFADFAWNAVDVGLVAGDWQISATQTISGQSTTSTTKTITVTP